MMSQSVTTNPDKTISDKPVNQTVTPDERVWSEVRIRMWIAAAFLLLFLATFLVIAPKIQQRLDRQTKNRIEQAGINAANLEFDWNYRNLTVSGYLPDGISATQLATILRGSADRSSVFFAKGIRHLRLNLDEGVPDQIVAAEESLMVEVIADASVATLNGVVQNDSQRRALVKAMLASGVENVFDNLDVQALTGTAEVNNRVEALSKLLREVGPQQIQRAEITLTQDELNYRVTARDKTGAVAIESAAAVEIADFNVTGGVDLLSLNRLNLLAESNGEVMTVNGTVFSDSHRKRLIFAASEAVGGENVVDNLILADQLSDASELMAHVEGMAAVVSRFAPGITGNVVLNNGELQVNAEAGSQAVREYLVGSTAAAHNAGLSIVDNVRVLMPQNDTQALQSALNQLIDEVQQTVVFSSGESILSPAAMQTLDKVASRINGFSGLVVEIEGHTDNVGRAVVNEQLSQTRANAVRNYLVSAVADGSRLIAVGYGHRRPIESNDTAEGRQANRRVRFTVLKQVADLNG